MPSKREAGWEGEGEPEENQEEVSEDDREKVWKRARVREKLSSSALIYF